MKFDLLDLSAVAVSGGVVGFLSGLFGVGGGFLIVPVLNIVLGIQMEVAVGSGVCQVLGPATTSLMARRIHPVHLRLPLTIFGGLFVGVFAGAHTLHIARSTGEIELPGKTIAFSELLVLVAYFVLLIGLGLFALWEVWRTNQNRPIKRGWLAHWKIPPSAEFPEFDKAPISIPLLAWFGLGVGFLSGLLGISGGLILLPGLIYFLGLPTHQSVMSSMVVVWIVSAQATIAHAWHDSIDLSLVMALLVGATVGARIGSDLSVRLGSRQLRQGFGWLLLGTGIVVGARLARLLWPLS